MHIDKKTIRNIFLGAAACIVLYWLLNEWDRVSRVWDFLRNILSPFVVGAIFAFILNVPMRAIEGWLKGIPSPRWRRALALVLTIFLILLVLAGVVMLLIPQLEETLRNLMQQLPAFFEGLQKKAYQFLEQRPELLAWVNENIDLAAMNWSTLIETALSYVGNSLASILNSTITVVGVMGGATVNAVISLVFAFYCLSSKENLARQGRRIAYALLPEKVCDKVVRVLRMTNSAFSNFITGQCLEAVILALLFVIAMAIFGMPYIPLISVLVAITAFIPVVGAWVGCIIGAFLIFVASPMQAVWFVVMFVVLQQIENNIIYPRVVGTSIGLSGMWVLIAVALGGELMGVVGMFLMIPVTSVVYTLIRGWVRKRLKKRPVREEKLEPHPMELPEKMPLKKPGEHQQHHYFKRRKNKKR